MRPLILISNDDGYQSNGLKVLIEAMRPLGDLMVIAPDKGRSGAAASLTTEVPVSLTRIKREDGLSIYACSGTPADCAKLALDQMLMRQPDLVVSGINHGSNASVNIHYSGTIAVASEGALHGIPSVAFSSVNPDPQANLSHLSSLCSHIAAQVLNNGLPFGSYLNVNFPDTEVFEGVRVCKMAFSRWIDEFEPCERGRGGQYFWLSGDNIDEEPNNDSTDLWALTHDYVAITPIKIDPTDFQLINSLQNWDL